MRYFVQCCLSVLWEILRFAFWPIAGALIWGLLMGLLCSWVEKQIGRTGAMVFCLVSCLFLVVTLIAILNCQAQALQY